MEKIFFASNKAKRNRQYREGQSVNITAIACVGKREIEPGFWRVELDSTGTCYIDVIREM